MKAGGSFEQCYNAQAGVEVETMLVVGQHVCDAPNDKEQLAPALEAAGSVSSALADSGFFGERAVAAVAEVMAHRLETKSGRDLYALRKQTVEPVFGIIKEAIGFRRFTMRGLEKAGLEWTPVTTAYNLRRLFNLGAKLARA